MSPGPKLTVIACSRCPLFNLGNLLLGHNMSRITGALNPLGDGNV